VQVISKASIIVQDSWWLHPFRKAFGKNENYVDKIRGCHKTCSRSPSVPVGGVQALFPSFGQESVLFKIILGLCRLR
jgi:hypothetical protein